MGTMVIAGADAEWLIGQRKPQKTGISLAEARGLHRGHVSVFRARGFAEITEQFGAEAVGVWLHPPTMSPGDVLLLQRETGFDWYVT